MVWCWMACIVWHFGWILCIYGYLLYILLPLDISFELEILKSEIKLSTCSHPDILFAKVSTFLKHQRYLRHGLHDHSPA